MGPVGLGNENPSPITNFSKFEGNMDTSHILINICFLDFPLQTTEESTVI